MLKELSRLYHTVKYLKPIQIVGRLQLFIPRRISEQKDHPKLRSLTQASEFCNKPTSTSDFNEFTFLSESHRLSDVGWKSENISKLWSYNLHYFDYIHSQSDWNESKKKKIREIMQQWVDENPFGKGTGWEPYPASLRIVNWVKWHLNVEPLSQKTGLSLWNQLRWLSDRPEIHLLGNHLFANAKAMIIGSALFEGEESMRIQNQGLKILKKQLIEQFLADGGHFERSPMYHALAVEDLLDLYILNKNFSTGFPKAEIKEKIKKGIQWLSLMSYGNGEFPHFNDCANSIAPTLSQLEKMAKSAGIQSAQPENEEGMNRLMDEHSNGLKERDVNLLKDEGVTHLKESGFVIAKRERSKLIADVGDIGPAYQPGHAHAESLSFELSVRGHRVIVNSGTSLYGVSAERLRQRSTSAHSTVEIDGQNSSEVWSGFRVAERAKVQQVQIDDPDLAAPIVISASHDGYQRLPGKNIHRRTWKLDANSLTIHDQISGKFSKAVSRLYIHPDFACHSSENGAIFHHEIAGTVSLIARSGKKEIPIVMKESTYHPAFGVSMKNSCVEIIVTDTQEVSIELKWKAE